MEIADFYVRELVARGIITVAHVPTEFMLADVLTKPLAKIKFFRLINAILGVAPVQNNCWLADPQWDNRAKKQLQHDRDNPHELTDKDVLGVSGKRGRGQIRSHNSATPQISHEGRPPLPQDRF